MAAETGKSPQRVFELILQQLVQGTGILDGLMCNAVFVPVQSRRHASTVQELEVLNTV